MGVCVGWLVCAYFTINEWNQISFSLYIAIQIQYNDIQTYICEYLKQSKAKQSKTKKEKNREINDKCSTWWYTSGYASKHLQV